MWARDLFDDQIVPNTHHYIQAIRSNQTILLRLKIQNRYITLS
jgi:hypothetical protein